MINYDLKQVKALLFDVDGVLSADCIPLHPSGEPMRMINIKDGYALQLAVKMGLTVGIITGGTTESVRVRFAGLGIPYIYMGAAVKINALNDFMSKTGIPPDSILYMGDDVPDYEVMKRVGLPCAPSDAAPDIKKIARYVSHCKGGYGAGRDVIEQVLKAQGKWMVDEAFGW